MSRITREEVVRVATLARLSLSGDEVSRMTSQLDAILDYVELLRAVDTKGVEATSHAVPIRTPLREDGRSHQVVAGRFAEVQDGRRTAVAPQETRGARHQLRRARKLAKAGHAHVGAGV